jgi:hypothetical protein
MSNNKRQVISMSILKCLKYCFYLHLIFILFKGFQHPFRSIGSFCSKFFIIFIMLSPYYIFFSILGGLILAKRKAKK